jgi:molecular chaperone DnaJ
VHNDINRDLYEILGVPRNASPSEIKSAYRSRARECHPDVAHDDPDGEHKFKELTFAYEILSDEQKRGEYDAFGLEGLRRGAGVDFNGFSSISDLFDIFFGGGFTDPFSRGSRRRGRTDGRDMEVVEAITLSDVLDGTEREIELDRRATCSECDGTGLMPGTHMSTCSTCGGSGQMSTSRRGIFGTMISTQTCPRCRGAGQVISEPCARCGGAGVEKVNETIQVSIPPGVQRGDRLRVMGKGEGGVRGGSTGDLHVIVDIEPDSRFERQGTDLYTRAEVDMVDAALGSRVEIESLDGPAELRVPEGTQPGAVLKVKGKGLPPRYGGRRGDMLVRVDVRVPRKLSAREKKILQSYLEARKEKTRR